MPPKSKAQSRLMRAVAHGDVKLPGMSRSKASEYVEGYSTKKLPERVGKKKKKNYGSLKKKLGM